MMSNARHSRLAPWVLLAAACALAACTSAFDALPEKMGGLPASAPARPAETLPYHNVYEVRPTRPLPMLNNAEQKQLEADLVATREEQKLRANPPPPPPPAKKGAAKGKDAKGKDAKDKDAKGNAAAKDKPPGKTAEQAADKPKPRSKKSLAPPADLIPKAN